MDDPVRAYHCIEAVVRKRQGLRIAALEFTRWDMLSGQTDNFL